MRRARPIVFWLVVVLLVALVPGAAAAAPAAQAGPTVFVALAHLSGGEEVPPVTETAGRGVAVYRLSPDGTALEYTLVAFNLTGNPVAAHIHAPASRGQNAGVVAFLFPPNARSTCSSTSATLLHCKGSITAANLVGPLAGQPLSALLELMAAGQTYTNVHTPRFPAGEVRGQNEPIIQLPTSLAP